MQNRPDYDAIRAAKNLPTENKEKLKIKSKYRYESLKKMKYLSYFQIEQLKLREKMKTQADIEAFLKKQGKKEEKLKKKYEPKKIHRLKGAGDTMYSSMSGTKTSGFSGFSKMTWGNTKNVGVEVRDKFWDRKKPEDL